MDREIKFRGQVNDDFDFTEINQHYKKGDWVYGSVVWEGKQPYIVGKVLDSSEDGITFEFWLPVIPETLGQYIGTNKFSDIYEGDIANHNEAECCGKVLWSEDTLGFVFYIQYEDGSFDGESLFDYFDGLTTIGNIHDNPELLEVV